MVEALRDHWSHIDERAVGLVKKKADPAAENAFEFVQIISEREFSDGTDTLGIDQESTDLCIATRDYLVHAWTHIVAAAHNERQALEESSPETSPEPPGSTGN